jgi:dipeptidyl aminopeptidase/acylaminoacyl peptidase
MSGSHIAAALAGLLLLGAGAAFADPPTTAAFGRLPVISQAALSPNGRQIALLGGSGDQPIISIAPVDGSQAVSVGVGRARVSALTWAGDDYLIVRSSALEHDTEDNTARKITYHTQRDYIVSAAGKVTTSLLKDSSASQYLVNLPPLLRILPGPRPVVFAEGAEWKDPISHPDVIDAAIWRVDVVTGAAQLAEKGTSDTSGWLVDLKGQSRVMFKSDPAIGLRRILVRAKGQSDWKVLAETADEDARPIPEVLGYSDPEDAVYVAETSAAGAVRLLRRSLSDGAQTEVPLDRKTKSVRMTFDEASGAPMKLTLGGAVESDQWLDARVGDLRTKLGRALKDAPVEIVGWSTDHTSFVIRSDNADTPPQWYFFDSTRGQLSSIAAAYPELQGAALGHTSWFAYKARDGLEIPASLTLPPGAPISGGRVPLVVLLHDGPGRRDSDRFDWLDQFLASRGYAVLRPQYRGTSGFGAEFERAGRKEINGKVLTDILDGVSDLAARGVVDPKRVCALGRGLGGYEALAGAMLHPEAYACAASINGYSDAGLWLNEIFKSYAPDADTAIAVEQLVGRRPSEAAEIARLSPAEQAANSRSPILLIVSTDNTDVPMEQSLTMQAALRKAGKPVDLLTLQGDDELSSSEARTRALDAVAAFLAKNLPPTH